MDSFDTTNTTEPAIDNIPEETELSHSDKVIGIISEPSTTFEKVSRFPLKTIDWLLPVIIAMVVSSIAFVIMMSNPEIKMHMQEQQMEQMRKSFDEQVKQGKITREQADQQLEQIQEGMSKFGPGFQIAMGIAWIFIGGFILFFFISLIFFVFAKFVLKGDGSYTSVLVANGLTNYILILEIIVGAILSVLAGRMMFDVSLAGILNADRTTYLGWLMGRINPFSIWVYIILSIGLAKLFKSASTGKYFVTVFGIWLVGTLLVFVLGKAIPFLGNFAR